MEQPHDEAVTEPPVDNPAPPESAANQGAAEESAADEGAAEESATDAGAADESAVEESGADEGAGDESAAADSAAAESATADSATADSATADSATADSATADSATAESATAEDAVDEGELDYEQLVALYDESMRHLEEGQIVKGRVVGLTANEAVVDVGYKSEGMISLAEFADGSGEVYIEVGDEVDVLLEKTEDQEGHILLSKVKAERMRIWQDIEYAYKEGSIITGRVIDRIKGGLTVDVGLRAFLPGSLVDIRPVKHLESLKGQDMEFKVISLDRRRNNIVLSRKAVLEKEFAK